MGRSNPAVATAEGERARQGREGFIDRGGRDARHGRLAIHRGPVRLEDVERPLRVEHHADVGEDLQRGLVDAGDVVVRHDLQRPARARVAALGVRCHVSPFGDPDDVRVVRGVTCGPAVALNCLVTNGDVKARTKAS